VTVLAPPPYPDYDCAIEYLTDAKGERLTEQTHKGCPGAAAVIYCRPGEGGAFLTHAACYCLDPNANGHTKRGMSGGTARDPEAEREQRRQVIAGNKEWRSAQTVRRRWLCELVARKSAPDGALRFVIESLARGDGDVTRSLDGTHAMARELLGLPAAEQFGPGRVAAVVDLVTGASDGRALVIALALIAGAYEGATGVHIWRNTGSHPVTGRYFATLASWGYEPAPIEQAVITGEPYTPGAAPASAGAAQ
jgi:ParB family transcriptional regulator, chromosome partitioning protein